MKCSLLTLSTFIDEALPAERRAEVDAHLVGCPRCSAGAATLREEKVRIAQLARVRVHPTSAQTLLEQVGITGAVVTEQLERAAPATSPPPAAQPWMAGAGSATLPWIPRRPPGPPPPAAEQIASTEEPPVPIVSPDVQPDLPFDSAPAAAARLASPEVGADPDHPRQGVTTLPSWADRDDEPAAPLEPWEAAVPSYSAAVDEPAWKAPLAKSAGSSDGDRAADDDWKEALAAPARVVPEVADTWVAPPSGSPGAGPTPARLQAPTGFRSLWERARDMIAVRLALARGGGEGAAPGGIVAAAEVRQLPPPIPGFEAVDRAVPPPLPPSVALPIAEQGSAALAAANNPARDVSLPSPADEMDERDMELTGFPGLPGLPAPSPPRGGWMRARRERTTSPATDADQADDDDESWNAFGASAFRAADPPAAEAAMPRTTTTPPVGRHGRALRRQSVSAGARLAAAAAGIPEVVRSVASRIGPGSPSRPAAPRARTVDRRVLAAAAVVVLIFVVALVIGRSAPHANNGTASRGTPSTAASHAPSTSPTAAAPSGSGATAPSATPPAATTAPLSGVQTFGTGANGFQVLRARYGTFSGAQRVVFDLGPASGSASGMPLARIGFTDATTMLVTFNGTLPAGSLAAPPAGGVVTSITRVASSPGTSAYRFTLSRASTPVAFYLKPTTTEPLRFVLDMH